MLKTLFFSIEATGIKVIGIEGKRKKTQANGLYVLIIIDHVNILSLFDSGACVQFTYLNLFDILSDVLSCRQMDISG